MWVRYILLAIRGFKIFALWPVVGFEAIRIYYTVEGDAMHHSHPARQTKREAHP
jgi:hypothetical protein